MNKHTRKTTETTLRLANRENACEATRMVAELRLLADRAMRYATRLEKIAEASLQATGPTVAGDARQTMEGLVSELESTYRLCQAVSHKTAMNAAAAQAAFDAFASTEDDEAAAGDTKGDEISDREDAEAMTKAVRALWSMCIHNSFDTHDDPTKDDVVTFLEDCDLDYDAMNELLSDFGIDPDTNEGARRERLETIANDVWVERKKFALHLAKLGASPRVIAEAI